MARGGATVTAVSGRRDHRRRSQLDLNPPVAELGEFRDVASGASVIMLDIPAGWNPVLATVSSP